MNGIAFRSFRNRNSSQKNTSTVFSGIGINGKVPKERAPNLATITDRSSFPRSPPSPFPLHPHPHLPIVDVDQLQMVHSMPLAMSRGRGSWDSLWFEVTAKLIKDIQPFLSCSWVNFSRLRYVLPNLGTNSLWPFYSQEWSTSNIPRSLTRNITSAQYEELGFLYSLLRWKMIIHLPTLTTSHTHLLFGRLGECILFSTWEWKG